MVKGINLPSSRHVKGSGGATDKGRSYLYGWPVSESTLELGFSLKHILFGFVSSILLKETTMNAAQFKKNLDTIKKGQARFTMIHEAACFALEQINSHGQTTPANQLLGVMHRADRTEALKTWFKDFGKCKELKDSTLEYVHKKELVWDGEAIEATEMLEVAVETPYFVYTKEIKPASSYDVMKGIKAIINRAKATQTKGLTVEHAELLEKLAAFIPAK